MYKVRAERFDVGVRFSRKKWIAFGDRIWAQIGVFLGDFGLRQKRRNFLIDISAIIVVLIID